MENRRARQIARHFERQFFAVLRLRFFRRLALANSPGIDRRTRVGLMESVRLFLPSFLAEICVSLLP